MVKKVEVNPNLDAAAFRKELMKIMPGYEWTVHRNSYVKGGHISATGIQSSGFNRMSTLQVVKREASIGPRHGEIEYEVKSSGFGKKAPWLAEATRSTLAQALRALQECYEH